MLGEWLGWCLAFLLAGCLAFSWRRRPHHSQDELAFLKKSDLMWCLLPLNERGVSSFPSDSFVCSESFLATFNQRHVTWMDLMSVFGCALDSPFQIGIRRLLLGETRHVAFEVRWNDSDYSVDLSLIDSDHVSSEENGALGILLIVTAQPSAADIQKTVVQLQKENSELQSVLQALPFPIWARNKEGKITYCNKAYAKLLETHPHKILSWQWELIDGEDAAAAQSLYKRTLAEGEPQSLRVKKVYKGREQDWVITEAAISAEMGVSTQNQVAGMAVDLSNYLLEFLHQKDRLDTYRECISDLAIPCCLLSPEATVAAFSQEFANILAIDEERLRQGAHVNDILEMLRGAGKLPEYIEFSTLKERCQRWLANPSQEFHGLWSFPSGESFEVLARSCGHGHVLVSLREVSQILTLERRLKSIKSVWEFTIENAYEALMVVGLDHRIHKVSQSVQNILGFDTADIKGKPIKEILDILAQKYGALGGCQALEEALEMRKQYTMKLETAGLTGSYSPLPDGRHLLSFVPMRPKLTAISSQQSCLLFGGDLQLNKQSDEMRPNKVAHHA